MELPGEALFLFPHASKTRQELVSAMAVALRMGAHVARKLRTRLNIVDLDRDVVACREVNAQHTRATVVLEMDTKLWLAQGALATDAIPLTSSLFEVCDRMHPTAP